MVAIMAKEAEDFMASGKGRAEIYSVVLSWFQDKRRGEVLDVPAGPGYLARKLKDMGFSIKCGEINPSIFDQPDIECEYMDMTSQIPYPDESFDYVTCIEGLEHATDPYASVSEISRVLRKGGFAVFSIPNYCNIEKRFKFLLTGYLTKPKTLKDFQLSGNLFDFHNSPLTITLLDFIFQINNLRLISILKDKTKKKQLVFYPLVLLLKFLDFLAPEEKRLERRSDLTLRKDVILGGNTLILVTQKVI